MKTEPLHLNFYDLEVDSLPPEFKALANVESEDLLDEPQGFWKRQFSQEPTRKQRIFDWAYGVVIPLICVAADPIIFRTSGPYGSGLLGSARPFAYLLSAASILAMAAWLLWGERLRWLAAPMAGLFFVGGGVSLLVGLILIPFSVIGLIFFLVGLLGFTPLLSSVVFLRNGLRAYRSAAVFLDDSTLWRSAFLAAVFSFVIPYVVNMEVSKLLDEIVKGDVNTINREAAKLRYIAPLVEPAPIARRYFHRTVEEEDSPRMQQLAEVYRQLSGKDIEGRRGFSIWD